MLRPPASNATLLRIGAKLAIGRENDWSASELQLRQGAGDELILLLGSVANREF